MNTGKEYKVMAAIRSVLKRFIDMKISLKLMFSYIAAVTVCILSLGSLYYFITKNYMEKQTTELLGETLKQTKNTIDYKVDLYHTLLASIYGDANIQDLLYHQYASPAEKMEPQQKILAYIRSLKRNYKDLTELSIIVSNRTLPPYGSSIIQEYTMQGEKWYKEAVSRKETILWMQEPEVLSGDRMLIVRKLNHLIFDSYLGMVRLEVDTNEFFKPLDEVGDQSKGWFDITDDTGNIIYSGMVRNIEANKELVHKEYSPAFFQTMGMQTLLTVKNQKFILMQDTIRDTGWRIIYAVPLDMYTSAVNNLKAASILMLLPFMSIFAGISWYLASRFTQKIRELSHSMEKIQIGNFNVYIPYTPNDEIGHLIKGFNIMAGKLKALVEEVYVSKVREKESELKALQAQINPHFLYNTLASISMLGIRTGEGDITRMSNSLARFYRLSLSKGKSIIKVKNEIEHIKAYIDIQNIRFTDKIKMLYEIDEELMEAGCLKFILQPFVENALVHGIWKDKSTITIRILVKKEGEFMVWTVIDDGVGIGRERLKYILCKEENSEGGYGMMNVDQRVKLFFGDQFGVHVFSQKGAGTVVTIKTPIKTTANG